MTITSRVMNIGIDLHGTIDADPALFREKLPILSKTGAVIHVISGPPAEDVENELLSLGLSKGNHYDNILSIVDHLLASGVDMELRKSGWWTDEETWWGAKGAICTDNSIDIHVDDRVEYMTTMPDDVLFILVGEGGVSHLEALDMVFRRTDRGDKTPVENGNRATQAPGGGL